MTAEAPADPAAMAAGFVAALEDVGLLMAERDRLKAQLAAAEDRHAKLRAALSLLHAWPDGVTGKRMVDSDDLLAVLNLDAASPPTPEADR